MSTEWITRKQRPARFFAGWALQQAAALDAAGARGLLADLYSQSVLKRQAAFCVMAVFDSGMATAAYVEALPKPTSDLCEALRVHTARELISAAYKVKHVSTGLFRALQRIGAQPLSKPGDYLRLFELLHSTDSNELRKADALRHCPGQITSARLYAVDYLADRILTPGVLGQCAVTRDCDQMNAALSILKQVCSCLDSEGGYVILRNILVQEGPRGLYKMLERADRLPTPPIHAEGLVPLTTAAEINRVAVEYRNCLRSRIGYVALGKVFYYLIDAPDGDKSLSVVVELEALSNGLWKLSHLETKKGMFVSSTVRRSVIRMLMNAGVVVSGSPNAPTYAGKVGSIFQTYANPFGIELDEEEDDEDDAHPRLVHVE